MRGRQWTDELLRVAVSRSISIAEVCRELGLGLSTGNYRTLKKWIAKLNIDASHFLGQSHGKSKSPRTFSDEVVFSENSPVPGGALKRRVIKRELLPYVCALCNQEPFWNARPLVLVLDHINGICNDHRPENLRFLCPNCNSQQPSFCSKTFCGEARRKGVKVCIALIGNSV